MVIILLIVMPLVLTLEYEGWVVRTPPPIFNGIFFVAEISESLPYTSGLDILASFGEQISTKIVTPPKFTYENSKGPGEWWLPSTRSQLLGEIETKFQRLYPYVLGVKQSSGIKINDVRQKKTRS